MIQRLNDDTDVLSRAEIVEVAKKMEQNAEHYPANRSESQQKTEDKADNKIDPRPKAESLARNLG